MLPGVVAVESGESLFSKMSWLCKDSTQGSPLAPFEVHPEKENTPKEACSNLVTPWG